MRLYSLALDDDDFMIYYTKMAVPLFFKNTQTYTRHNIQKYKKRPKLQDSTKPFQTANMM